jgi:glycosyltransferase involved in cell wall biosynthesis
VLEFEFSVLTYVHEPHKKYLMESLRSVIDQTHSLDKAELILIIEKSDEEIRSSLTEAVDIHPNTKILVAETYMGHSNAINLAASLAIGRYLVILDQDDLLAPEALENLSEFIERCQNPPEFLYSDYRIVSQDGIQIDEIKTPDFSPIRFMNLMYNTYPTFIKRDFWNQLLGFNNYFDGAHEYEFFLRAIRNTQFVHVPGFLLSSRLRKASHGENDNFKQLDIVRAKMALEANLESANLKYKMYSVDHSPTTHRIDFLPNKTTPLSIIIPTQFVRIGQDLALNKLLRSIKSTAKDKDFEIVCVIDFAKESTGLKSFIDPEFIVNWVNFSQVDFNFSKAVNFGIENSSNSNILVLNDDMEFLTDNWFEILAGFLEQPDIGIVGAKLFYPDGRVQHAGIGVSDSGHCFHTLNNTMGTTGELGEGLINHEVDAVTGAFMGFRRVTWRQIGGFPEKFPGNYNDVALCLKSWNLGKSVIQVNSIELIHYESLSRESRRTEKEISDFQDFLRQNPKTGNFTLTQENLNSGPTSLTARDFLNLCRVLIRSDYRRKVMNSIKLRGPLGAVKNFWGL